MNSIGTSFACNCQPIFGTAFMMIFGLTGQEGCSKHKSPIYKDLSGYRWNQGIEDGEEATGRRSHGRREMKPI
jgi:hypothetical protein